MCVYRVEECENIFIINVLKLIYCVFFVDYII